MTDPMSIRRSDFKEAAQVSRETGEPVYFQNGDSVSVVVDAEIFERIGARLEQLELENKLRQGFLEIDAGKGIKFRDFWKELDGAMKDAGF